MLLIVESGRGVHGFWSIKRGYLNIVIAMTKEALLISPVCLCSLWNPRVVWVGKNLKEYPVPTPLPWTGPPSTRPGSSMPCVTSP